MSAADEVSEQVYRQIVALKLEVSIETASAVALALVQGAARGYRTLAETQAGGSADHDLLLAVGGVDELVRDALN